MEEIRQLIQNENIAAQKLRLNYLSETLLMQFKKWKTHKKNSKLCS